ncbi:MAG: DNA-binding protein [Terriglobia bacterium]|jgi:plasmid stability protein
MATLYVQNVPDDLYDALRNQARQRGSSIAAEVVAILKETVPTAQELRSRRALLRRVERLQSRRALRAGPWPSTEEMLREDRSR